jgi:hypothetical protein
MLKLVAGGIWIILVTAGATFASVYLSAGAPEGGVERQDAGVEELTSDMTSIPVMRNGDITGYLILQLSFAADRALLEEKKLDPLPFMKDAAFRVIISSTDIDFRHLKKGDLEGLAADVAKEANERIGGDLVRSVLLQQFNFVKKEDIRTNWIGSSEGTDH